MTKYSFMKQDNTIQQIVETNLGLTKDLPKNKRKRNKSMETKGKNEQESLIEWPGPMICSIPLDFKKSWSAPVELEVVAPVRSLVDAGAKPKPFPGGEVVALDPGQANSGQGEGGRDAGVLEQPQVQSYPGVKPTGLQRGVSLEEVRKGAECLDKKRSRRSQIDNVAPTQIDTEAPTKGPLQRRSRSRSNSSSRSSAASRSRSGSKASKVLKKSRAISDACSRLKQSK